MCPSLNFFRSALCWPEVVKFVFARGLHIFQLKTEEYFVELIFVPDIVD